MEIECINPKLQKQKAQQLGYSESTIERHRDQKHMPSPHKRKKTKKKKMSCQDAFITSENAKIGNSDDENTFFSGQVSIEKGFNNFQMNEIIEKKTKSTKRYRTNCSSKIKGMT